MQALKLIYSYLSNRIQSVKVKDAYSSTSTVLSGVPQGSLLSVILFNIQFNDIFDITESGLYNFADDNNLSAIGDTVEEAKSTLKQQTTNVLKWFDENHLIANPEKFHLMFLLPNKTDQAMNEQLLINNTTLDGEPSITVLGMEIDDNSLTFNTHIGNLCKKAASQLNVLKHLSRFMGYNERRIIMQSFILSNFNYCALIWHFCRKFNTAKIEKIQERALRLVLDDYISDYSTLLKTSGIDALKTKRIKTLATEICKAMNPISPKYMKEVFKLNESKTYDFRSQNALKVERYNTVRYEKRA